jgi:hypothetical protein
MWSDIPRPDVGSESAAEGAEIGSHEPIPEPEWVLHLVFFARKAFSDDSQKAAEIDAGIQCP